MEFKDIANILNSKAVEKFAQSNAGNSLSNLASHIFKTLSIPFCLTNYISYDTNPYYKRSFNYSSF